MPRTLVVIAAGTSVDDVLAPSVNIGSYGVEIGNLSIDDESDDDDVPYPRKTGETFSFSAGKLKVKQPRSFDRRRHFYSR